MAEADGNTARFTALAAEYARAPEVTRERLYLETMEQVLGASTMDAVRWDAHRREDGRWVVTAAVDGETAEWTYDHHGRNLHALNEPARRLLGATPTPVEDEVDIAEALDLVAEVPVVRDEPDTRPRLAVVPTQQEDADGASESEPVVEDAAARVGGGYEQETITLPRGSDAPTPEPAADDQTPAKRANRKPKARKGRTSVPSWDEILFGAGRSDD